MNSEKPEQSQHAGLAADLVSWLWRPARALGWGAQRLVSKPLCSWLSMPLLSGPPCSQPCLSEGLQVPNLPASPDRPASWPLWEVAPHKPHLGLCTQAQGSVPVGFGFLRVPPELIPQHACSFLPAAPPQPRGPLRSLSSFTLHIPLPSAPLQGNLVSVWAPSASEAQLLPLLWSPVFCCGPTE